MQQPYKGSAVYNFASGMSDVIAKHPEREIEATSKGKYCEAFKAVLNAIDNERAEQLIIKWFEAESTGVVEAVEASVVDCWQFCISRIWRKEWPRYPKLNEWKTFPDVSDKVKTELTELLVCFVLNN